VDTGIFPNVPPGKLKNSASGLFKIILENKQKITFGVDICRDLGRLHMALFNREVDKFLDTYLADDQKQRLPISVATVSKINKSVKDGVDIFLHPSAGGPLDQVGLAARVDGYNFHVNGQLGTLEAALRTGMLVIPTMQQSTQSNGRITFEGDMRYRYDEDKGPNLQSFFNQWKDDSSLKPFLVVLGTNIEEQLSGLDTQVGLLNKKKQDDKLYKYTEEEYGKLSTFKARKDQLINAHLESRVCLWNDLRPALSKDYPLAYPAHYKYTQELNADCLKYNVETKILNC